MDIATWSDVPERGGAGRRMAGGLATVDAILRDAGTVASLDSHRVIRTLIITIALTAGTFGLVLGAFRGGAQLAYAAIKLPLAVLLTAAVATPALMAARRAAGMTISVRRDLVVVLSSLTLGTLLLASLAPVVLLAVLLGVDYHRLVLLAVVSCGLAGAAAMQRFWRGLGHGPGRTFIAATTMAVALAVGCQMTWTLRPFVVRPRTTKVPFVRSLEGSFLESVGHHVHWASGRYRDPAPQPR